MTTQYATLLVVGLTLAACARVEPSRLPYFSDHTLTPVWLGEGDNVTAHKIAPWSFIDQAGARFSQADADGKIYVASFIFTRCGGICPTMVQNLRKVNVAFADDRSVLLLSHTVDPGADTPEVLARYAKERGIDRTQWRLLTGDRELLYHLARASYFADDDTGREISANDFLHTEKVLLVDSYRHIRGVYNGTLPIDMDRLIDDIRALQTEPL